MGFTTNGKEHALHVHPFDRASPSVINRPIKAGSLLSPTCPSRDIRAMPSVPQAATPMKPRANPGNRTRQPKGRASRIAKPTRLSRASQNHLMMIILNKTVAATVAQHDLEPLAVHAQSETTAYERHVLCANFSKTRALFLLLSHRPRQKYRAGGGSPRGGCLLYVQHWNVCAVVFWRVVWYLRGRDRINVVPGHAWPPCPWPCRPSCPWACRGYARLPWLCRGRRGNRCFPSPSCGCDTPTNASVSNGFDGVSLSRLAQQICCVYSESHQANDNERNGDEEVTTTKATTARTVTRSPPSRRGMDD